jgi:hypothetical protein
MSLAVRSIRQINRTTSKQAPMNPVPDATRNAALRTRNRIMHLMPEALARAHMEHVHRQAESERLGRRVLHAQRLRRKAETASLRARRALAIALMQ